MIKKEIRVPFAGFYETSASSEAERNCFMDWEKSGEYCDPEELPDKLREEFYDYCSGEVYKKYEAELVENYIANLFREIKYYTGIDLTPDNNEKAFIDSPREYNFTTDRLFIKVPEEKLIELYSKCDKKILSGLIKERFTSYDGFISSYDNNPESEEWTDISSFDHNQWEVVIEAIMEEYDIKEYYLYND